MKTTIKSIARIVMGLGLATLVFTSCASAGIIFQDDFNDGVKNGWTDSAGTPWWGMPNTSEAGGKFVFNSLGQSSADALNAMTDVDISVDVDVIGTGEGILIRYMDGNNYAVAMHNGTNQYIALFQCVSGISSASGNFATPGISFATGAYKMHAQVVGSQVTFGIYDAFNSYSTVATLDAGLLAPGGYGLWGDGGQQYDNFVASTVPEPGSLLALAGSLVCLAGAIRRRH